MDVERRGQHLIFRAGRGEWFNQPPDRRWDMGEDAQALPPAPWHTALEAAIRDAVPAPCRVVIDVTQMSWLVGQDWGFLRRLAGRLQGRGVHLGLAAGERVLRSAATLGLTDLITTHRTVEEAVGEARDER